MKPLLTVDEVARYLRTTKDALYSQRLRGEKPGVLGVKVGRRVLYRAADIDRYLDEQIEAQLLGRSA